MKMFDRGPCSTGSIVWIPVRVIENRVPNTDGLLVAIQTHGELRTPPILLEVAASTTLEEVRP